MFGRNVASLIRRRLCTCDLPAACASKLNRGRLAAALHCMNPPDHPTVPEN